MNKQYYLYTHTRPDTGEIFYVGISSDLPGRYSRAYEVGPGKRNSIWNKIWLKNKKQVLVDILDVYDDQQVCLDAEIELIKKYGRLCHNTGSLANISAGGEFTVGDPKQVLQYDITGKFLQEWQSVVHACKATGLKDKALYRALNGVSSNSGGYIWKWYSSDYPKEISVSIPTRGKKPVYQYDKDCNCIQLYESVLEASKVTGIDTASIFKAAGKKRQAAGGYIWSFDTQCKPYYPNKVVQYALDGTLIKIHDNLETAVKTLGLTSKTAIKNCFTGRQKQAYGYIWRKYPAEAKELGFSELRLN
jgi:hypothetical protein